MNEQFQTELLRLEENILYSEKANFQVCNIWQYIYWILGILNAIFGALAGLAATGTLFELQTNFFAISTGILAELMTFTNPNQRSEIAHKAGIRLSDLRNRIRRFRELGLTDQEHSKSIETLENFAKEKSKLLIQSPHTGGPPNWLAKRSIEKTKSHINEVDLDS